MRRRRDRYRPPKRRKVKAPKKFETKETRRKRKRNWLCVVLGLVAIAIVGVKVLAENHRQEELQRKESSPGAHVYAGSTRGGHGQIEYITLPGDPTMPEWVHVTRFRQPEQHYHIVHDRAQFEKEKVNDTDENILPVPAEIHITYLYVKECGSCSKSCKAQCFINKFQAFKKNPPVVKEGVWSPFRRAGLYIREKTSMLIAQL